MLSHQILILAPLTLLGCVDKDGGGSSDTAVVDSGGGSERWEGKYPGECDDDADNDGDGLYDCEDPDCFGAPDCDSGGGDSDGGDSDGGPTAIAITDITWNCGSNDGLYFSVTASGAPDGIDIYIGQDTASPWGPEYHAVDVTGAAADGSWATFEIDLPSVFPDFGAQVDGQNTGFICGKTSGPAKGWEYTLGFIFEVFSGDTAEDCRWSVGGAGVDINNINFDLSGCTEW